ncbi:MAG TPA: GAF domain-containing protein [Gemmatimonadaceae bacterium]
MVDQSRTALPLTEDFGGPADAGADPAEEVPRLRARLAELQRERDHLVAVVDILQEISSSLHFVDILQSIARKLGDAFGLDRCAIFLSGEQQEVRLVASYEDPSIRNLVVDINRYPELKRAFESGETVFIPDAPNDPMLRSVKAQLDLRNVRSIVVVPLQWQDNIIGAIFLRTDRNAVPFSDVDVRFCQLVASLTAKALRNAHRFESLMRQQQDVSATHRRAELQRIALVAFLRRLLDKYAKAEEQAWAETLLPKASDEELERLVAVAMQVLEEEAKG